jgi:DNA-binding NarL/FixJ family response regulator
MPDLLLVEDNPLHLRLVKSMLADIWPPNEVAEVRHARSLEEAVAQITANPPACVLLDLVLPDADGMDSLTGVRRADPLVPIVVLSSHENAKTARSAIEAGAQDYLVKGAVSPEDLERSVAFAMGRKDHERRTVAATPGLTPWPIDSGVAGIEAAAAPEPAAAQAPPPVPHSSDVNETLGVAVINLEGFILYIEPKVAAAIGRTVEELAAVPVEQLIHPNDLTNWRKIVSGDPGPANIRYMHESGHPIFLRITARHVVSGGDTGGAFVASFFARGEVGTASSGAYVVMSDWG